MSNFLHVQLQFSCIIKKKLQDIILYFMNVLQLILPGEIQHKYRFRALF